MLILWSNLLRTVVGLVLECLEIVLWNMFSNRAAKSICTWDVRTANHSTSFFYEFWARFGKKSTCHSVQTKCSKIVPNQETQNIEGRFFWIDNFFSRNWYFLCGRVKRIQHRRSKKLLFLFEWNNTKVEHWNKTFLLLIIVCYSTFFARPLLLSWSG